MYYLIMLFTSLLFIIANDIDNKNNIDNNDNISFLIFKDSIIKKTLTYEKKMNLLSNYMFLIRKVIGVNGNVYIRSFRPKSHQKM